MTLSRQNTLHEFMTGKPSRKSFRTSPNSCRSYSLRRATLAQSLSLPSSSFLHLSSESLNLELPFNSLKRKFSLGPSGIPMLILALECLN